MLTIIQTNASRLRELHRKVHETFEHRSESKKALKIWEDACRRFHSEYDSLAFPGGLNKGLGKIKAGDLQTIEIALNYLENTPYCFRSQYVATYLRRALNKIVLPPLFASRFAMWKEQKKKNEPPANVA